MGQDYAVGAFPEGQSHRHDVGLIRQLQPTGGLVLRARR